MGAACCRGRRATMEKKSKEQAKEETTLEEGHEKKKRPEFRSVAFDVVVPVNSPAASLGASGQFQPSSSSFAAFDQTMHTMRGDASLSMGPANLNNTFNLDTNMSFTNNFTDVNKDVVNMFLKTVKQITEGGAKTKNILEESVALGSDTTSSPKVVGAGANEMSAEDLEYIEDGATLAEKLSRLSEVEEVLRQNIYGTWSMNSTIIQLAMLRVVPTLRQRRRTWDKPKAANAGAADDANAAAASAASSPAAAATTSATGRGERAAKRPVLVVHAQGLQLDQSLRVMEEGSPFPTELFSPAHVEDSPSVPASAVPPARPAPIQTGLSSAVMDPLNRSMSRSGIDPTSAKVEHYEMVALTCRDIDVKDKVGAKVINDTWDFLADDGNINAVNHGECLFRFMCGPVKDFDQETLDTMNLFINRSSFADEEKENNTPKVNLYDPDEAAKYICISVKAMYMLPGTKLSTITPSVISSRDYQKHCQPSGNKLEDCDTPNTFRLTIVAIRFVLSFTVMFRVSEITDPNVLFSFKSADGIVPAKVIMMERTKRNVSKVDATAKVRSVLLYYPVNGGLLCNSHTFVLNTSLPKAVARLVNTFGASGATQSAETAKLTRNYLINTYGDSRK